MIDDDVATMLKSGIDHVYPGQWKDFAPGFGAYVETGGIGMIVLYNEMIKVGAGVLTDLALTDGLVREVGDSTAASAFGHLTIAEGAPGNWMVTCGYSVSPTWIDPRSRASMQLVLDMLSNLPGMVDERVRRLQPQFGGDRFSTDSGWWLALMDHI
jgi:hypothetical protein